MEKQTLAYHTSAEMPEKLAETAGLVPHELAKRTRVRKLWYCQQCGYVCFREQPPPICPICKAKKEMFADVILQGDRQ